MKKKLIYVLFIFFLLPISVFAIEEKILIDCDKKTLKNTEETECKIQANNLGFTTTSVSGKIQVSDNLKIISSSYDKNDWKVFDSKFSVGDINLISEHKNIENNFTIATFKIKAINKNNSTGEIKFINVDLGDADYNSHQMKIDDYHINLKFDKKNIDVFLNKSTTNIIVSTVVIIVLIGCCIFPIKKEKNK